MVCNDYCVLFIILYLDIDECATEIHNCTHVCQNNLGSFACGCELGCALSSDKATCEGMHNACSLYICAC